MQQILTAAGQPPAGIPSKTVAARCPRISLRRAPIGQSAQLLAEQADHLAGPGPVPVQGVAMVSQLLADGTGPPDHQACRDDLAAIIERATRALKGDGGAGRYPISWHACAARCLAACPVRLMFACGRVR